MTRTSRGRTPARTAASSSATGALALVLAAVWLLAQAWLLHARWVNPDEGAHLMDARLAIEGLIPMVDYGARQPLYVYAYVPFLQAFGGGYAAGRLMPLLATFLTALVLCAIGRRLAHPAVGISAALWYLFAPTILINAVVAKTEPLATLLVALGVWALLVHVDRKSWKPLALAGVSLGAGYYVRESTLGGLLGSGLMLLARGREGLRRLAGRWALLAGGYASVCAAVIVCYSLYMPLGQVLASRSLSPAARVTGSLQKLAAWWMPDAESAVTPWAVGPFEASQSAETIRYNLQAVFTLNGHLLLGALLAALLLAWAGRGRLRRAGERWALLVPLCWVGSMAAVYAYHVATRGFYQFYFRELIPPMALLLALVLGRWLPQERLVPVTAAGIAAALGLTAVQRVWPGSGALYALAMVGAAGWLVFAPQLTRIQRRAVAAGYAAVLALTVLVRFTSIAGIARHAPAAVFAAAGMAALLALVWRVRRGLPPGSAGRFIGLGLAGTALALSATASARVARLSYDCVWSSDAVRQGVELVRRHSTEGDEVISGAVIWEFEARRRPFMNLSHPLQYMYRMPPAVVRQIEQRLSDAPPRIVVVDGYTERTYLQHLPRLRAMLLTEYEMVGDVAGSRYPVRVFARREPSS